MSKLDPDLTMPASDTAAFREGLPSSYHMRADSHYVEELEADGYAPPIRLLDPDAIEGAATGPAPPKEFVESVRRHGVLQPLLVRGRGGRYRLIAGGKRLAAAVAAGMHRVPCVVQRVDDDEATRLAIASNLLANASSRPGAGPVPAAAARPAEGVTAELSRSLSALLSSVNLLSDGSFLTQPVASELVKAEAARAMHLLWTLRVLADDVPVTRTRLDVLDLAARARELFAPEQQLRNVRLSVGPLGSGAAIQGDRDLLTHAIVGLVRAGSSLPHADAGGPLTLRVTAEREGAVSVEVEREGLTIPSDWVESAFEQAWPVGAGPTTLASLQAARRVAQWHGGGVQVTSSPAGTRLAITLPTI